MSAHKKLARVFLGLGLPLLCIASFAKDEKAGDVEPARPVYSITTLKDGGARLDWLGNRIAFDMLVGGYSALYTMRQDGSDARCLSCGHPDLPGKNIGQPAWHPSGRYLALQAEKAEHDKKRFEHVVTPGAGVLNDLWLLDLETNRATLIREVENRPGQGILHPHFSADGRRLSWSEMQEQGGFKKGSEFGFWKLMVADFHADGIKSRLDNIRSYEPGGGAFYENHGFSPDGSRLIFSSNFEAKKRIESHIYTMDLQTENLDRLTTENYNEHALYSPDGKHIVWMTTAGNRRGGTDYWIMDSDGSNKRRLTYFNQKGYAEYAGERVIVADLSWRPDGTAFAGYYSEGGPLEPKDGLSRIVLIELTSDTEKSGQTMSKNKQTVQQYMEAFDRTDHAGILSCLTDDVEWVLPGVFHLKGKEAFDKEIENPAFVGSPDIKVTRMVEEGDIVVAEGSVRAQKRDGAVLNLLFCDVFEMRGGKIKKLISYLMEVK